MLYEDREDLQVAYSSGLCNAVSAPASWLNAVRRSLPEPATVYRPPSSQPIDGGPNTSPYSGPGAHPG